MPVISPERLSTLIGRIYDCAIEPDLWPQTMREICNDLRCLFSAILLVDLKHSRHRVVANWNAEEFARRAIGRHAEETTAIYRSAPGPMQNSLDEPLVLSRDVPARPPALSTAKDFCATSPPTVSKTASQPVTT